MEITSSGTSKPEIMNTQKNVYQRAEELWKSKYNSEKAGKEGQGYNFFMYNEAIDRFLEEVPDEIKTRFWAHGVTRGDGIGNLATVMNIIETGQIAGYSGIIGNGGFGAWTGGDALIVSKIDQSLFKEDSEGEYIRHEIIGNHGQITVMCEADIGAVILNNRLYPLVDELKTMYPDVKIISADEMKSFFEEEVQNS
ncbi:MAG TPA: hypothetical protein PKI92_03235 [Candidatus Woesebacteria bacterium]|nr:hypothetical protein [Candidatus Woesebacteria bacterium]HPR99830.1 hypothetical protein [Candidatus Woesebacteria bacterium]